MISILTREWNWSSLVARGSNCNRFHYHLWYLWPLLGSLLLTTSPAYCSGLIDLTYYLLQKSNWILRARKGHPVPMTGLHMLYINLEDDQEQIKSKDFLQIKPRRKIATSVVDAIIHRRQAIAIVSYENTRQTAFEVSRSSRFCKVAIRVPLKVNCRPVQNRKER